MNTYSKEISFNESVCALEYGCSITPLMQQLSQPLLPYGITTFTYSRIFKDGKRIYLCNNLEWLKHYICNNYFDEINHLEHYIPAENIKVSTWDGFKMDRVFSALYHQFNLWNGFTIYEKHEDYIDYFDFASHKNNYQVNSFYLNNFVLLEMFVHYFKAKIFYSIDSIEKHQLITPKICISFDEISRRSPFSSKKIESFYNTLSQGEDHKDIKNNIKYYNNVSMLKDFKVSDIERNLGEKLTEKEVIIALFISKGKTIKEISYYLGINLKATEYYLALLKKKIKAKTSKDIVRFYEQFIELSEDFMWPYNKLSSKAYNNSSFQS